MVYSVNGVALDNATRGWNLIKGSRLRTGLEKAVQAVNVQGRDGVVAGLPADAGPSMVTLVVDTPLAEFGSLHALISKGGTLTNSEYATRSAVFEMLSVAVEEEPDNSMLQVTYVLRVPGTYWRDTAIVSSGPTSLASASQVHDLLLPGLSAPVPDAIIRLKGALTGLQVTDSGGSWFTYSPSLASTDYLRFESDTGRAFVTTTNVWTGGSEVTGSIDFGGPRGVFELTPYWSGTDPSTRTARVTVATATRTSASVEAQARAAYVG